MEPTEITPQDVEYINEPQALVRQPTELFLTPVMDLVTAKQRIREFQDFVQSYLREGEDFGTIPGTPKPTLYKSGADKLCELYGLTDTYEIKSIVDFDKGLFDYEITCSLTSRKTGQLVATGVGSCSSYEGRYRWRENKRTCPNCSKATIIKGKAEYGGGWLCWKKEGKSDGCGAKFKTGDKSIEEQQIGRVENDDLPTMKNTVLKMAKKRAKVDATLSATRSSGLFTQDMEDSGEREAPGPSGVLCSDCGDEVTQAEIAASKIAFGKTLCSLCQKQAKPVAKAKPAEPKPIDGDKEKLLQDFLAALTQAFPASEVRQRVGQEILGCKTMQEMRKMSVNKLRQCAETLVELGERLKREPTTNADDICALVNLIQEDAR